MTTDKQYTITQIDLHCVNNPLKIVLPTHVSNSQCQVFINSLDLSITCPALAGRVGYFQPDWEVLTQDHWVLQTVGVYQLELTSLTQQSRIPLTVKCSEEAMAQITTKISELLSKGAIVEAQVSSESFVPQLFLVEKKGGS